MDITLEHVILVLNPLAVAGVLFWFDKRLATFKAGMHKELEAFKHKLELVTVRKEAQLEVLQPELVRRVTHLHESILFANLGVESFVQALMEEDEAMLIKKGAEAKEYAVLAASQVHENRLFLEDALRLEIITYCTSLGLVTDLAKKARGLPVEIDIPFDGDTTRQMLLSVHNSTGEAFKKIEEKLRKLIGSSDSTPTPQTT